MNQEQLQTGRSHLAKAARLLQDATVLKEPKLFVQVCKHIYLAQKELSVDAQQLPAHSILEKYAQSPVVFEKNNSLIICDEQYDMELLSAHKLALLLKRTAELYEAQE